MARKLALARSDPAREIRPDDAAGDRDYFVRKDGLVYAGAHVLIDFWGASHLNDIEVIERALREAAEACGARILHIHVHEFSSNGGVSGVALLAESHISVHTWPELDYAAFDVFMCGTCDPLHAVPVLRRHFQPVRHTVGEQKRGLIG